MECREVEILLDAWLDGELDRRRSGELEAHLKACGACSAMVHGMAGLVAVLDGLPGVEPYPGLMRRTLAAYRRETAPGGLLDWWRGVGPALRAATMALALTGLVCGALLGWMRGSALDRSQGAVDVTYIQSIQDGRGGLL